MSDVIVVSGPPGVGKTTVAWEMTEELQALWRQHPAEDFVVTTDRRGVRELAFEVLTRSGWI